MGDYYIGIDFGGTNIRFVVYESETDMFSQYKKCVVVQSDDVEEEVEKNIIIPLREIVLIQSEKGSCLRGIGMAMAAMFQRDTGNIVEWPNNKKYKGFPMKTRLGEAFGVEVHLEDDANSAALGELWKGEAREEKNFAYITISTGIGSGIILEEKPWYGNNGWAGELGHTYVTDDPECVCKCGRRGCLQAISSGKAIADRYNREKNLQEHMAGYAKNAEYVAKAAATGDTVAMKALSTAGEYIGKAIANMAVMLDFSLFVLGGGVLNIGESFVACIEQSINQILQGKRHIELRISQLNDFNSLIGVIKWMI